MSGSGALLNIGETLFQLFDSIQQDSFAQVIHTWAARAARLGRLRVEPQSLVIFAALNLTRPPFDDVHVRRALSWIVDKGAYRKQYGGATAGAIAGHILPDDLLHGRLKGFAPPRRVNQWRWERPDAFVCLNRVFGSLA